MNDLGMKFVWSAVQVTMFLIPAGGVHLFVSRRSPSSGAWLATCALMLTLVISVLPLVPLPVDEHHGRPEEAATGALNRSSVPPSMAKPAAGRLENPPAASAGDPAAFDFGHALGRFVGAWHNLSLKPIVPPVRFRQWGALIATIGIAGAITGLTRLVIGIWAIRLCRRRGHVIGDPQILGLLDELRLAMGCDQKVEIREVLDLTAPATAGWRRPLILLPVGWRGWNDTDRRAVLAHELAHIHRSDYAVGVIARLVQALEFYHPLVHWLTRNLILQQELAADAIGARHAGGTDLYLLSLSRLALDQDTGSAFWPARAFLPARGTLIRRIAMLQNDSLTVGQPLSRSRRLLSGFALIAIAMGVATLRGPARAGEDAMPSEPPKVSIQAPVNTDSLAETPFDVTFVPENAPGLIAFRPAATLRRAHAPQFLSVLLGELGGMPPMSLLPTFAKDIGIEPAAPGQGELALDQIESIIATLGFGKAQAGPNGRPMHRVDMGSPTIRTVKPFDWIGFLRAWHIPLTAVKSDGRIYYKIEGTIKRYFVGKSPCVYLPDSRTIVLKEEDELLKALSRTKPIVPSFLTGTDWERTNRALLAVAIDNKYAEISKTYDQGRPDDKLVVDLFKNVDQWIFCVDDTDSATIHARAACNADRGEDIAGLAESHLKMTRASLQARPTVAAASSIYERGWRMLGALMQNASVTHGARSVEVRSEGFGTLADLGLVLETIVGQQIAEETASHSPP